MFQNFDGSTRLACSPQVGSTRLACSPQVGSTRLACSPQVGSTRLACSPQVGSMRLACSPQVGSTRLACSPLFVVANYQIMVNKCNKFKPMDIYYYVEKIFNKRNKFGMTLIEILIVTSLMSIISLAIFNSLSSGIKIWKRSNRLIIEEDILIFFDKLTKDLNSSVIFSLIDFKGGKLNFEFAAIIWTRADERSGLTQGEYIDQIGKVKYSLDMLNNQIIKETANYSQAVSNKFGVPQVLVRNVDDITFKYYYLSQEKEILSDEVLSIMPSGVEVSVFFFNRKGQKKVLTKFIDIPIGG